MCVEVGRGGIKVRVICILVAACGGVLCVK